MKSPEPENKAQRKVEKLLQKLSAEIIRENYDQIIIIENYELVYQSRGKCGIYRDTEVSKNIFLKIQNRGRLPYCKALYKWKLISIKKWL